MTFKSTLVLAAAMTGLALAGCATQPADPVEVASLETISATVTAIDVKKRIVSLAGPEGRAATIEVPSDVRNLAQVKVGDKLVVRYYQSIGAALRPKGTAAAPHATDQLTGAALAEKGAKPGAAVGSVTATTVTVQSVDKKTNTVTFAGADGLVRSIQVKDPEAQKFAATLKKGDQVDLMYTEALAVSVEGIK
jgi:hypothetical protein